MTKTLATLLMVAVAVCVGYVILRALIPQFPEANVGLMGAMIGLIAGGILRQR